MGTLTTAAANAQSSTRVALGPSVEGNTTAAATAKQIPKIPSRKAV
jgi:hypothetical protein